MNTDKHSPKITSESSTTDSLKCLTIPAIEHLGIIKHAFTTRQNGFGERNSGTKLPFDWHPVAARFGISPDRLVIPNQVHSDTVVTVDDRNYKNIKTTQADALITHDLGIAVGIETADCVPVLLFDPKTPAVAAVHAGWRSTVKKILQKTLIKMNDEYGSDSALMIAAIGPAICPECYEVDELVMGPVRQVFPFWQEIATPRLVGRWSLNLVKANMMELVQAGLAKQNIHALDFCTSCRQDLFYSFRAEGKTGRMLSVIMLQP